MKIQGNGTAPLPKYPDCSVFKLASIEINSSVIVTLRPKRKRFAYFEEILSDTQNKVRYNVAQLLVQWIMMDVLWMLWAKNLYLFLSKSKANRVHPTPPFPKSSTMRVSLTLCLVSRSIVRTRSRSCEHRASEVIHSSNWWDVVHGEILFASIIFVGVRRSFTLLIFIPISSRSSNKMSTFSLQSRMWR